MGLFRRKKKPKSVEEISESTVIIQEKNPKETQHAALEYCEQIMNAAKDLEETKKEYKIVTDYLTDIQIIEDLPEPDMQKVQETAQNIYALNDARESYQKKTKTISDAQFNQMELLEEDIPDAIKRLKTNEAYQSAVKRDMQYLEGEKSEWNYYLESLEEESTVLRRLLYAAAAGAVLVLIAIVVLSNFFHFDIQMPLFIAVLAAGALGGLIYLRMQNDEMEMKKSQANINRAITLLNKVKLKYVNVTNAVDYACEKYHVKNSHEFNYNWEQYLEGTKEREKFQRTNEDLDYFNSRLIRDLHAYRLYDARVWVHQVHALLEKKEMVEVKHNLLVRRQKLRTRIEYQMSNIQNAREEIEKLTKENSQHETEIRQILDSIDKMCGIS